MYLFKKICSRLLGIGICACILSGCSAGGGGEGTSNTDTQYINSEGNTNGNAFTISAVINNCAVIPANGTCTINISSYTGTGYYNGPITLVFSENAAYTSNLVTNPTYCANAQSGSMSCSNITITNTSGSTSQASKVTFYFNSHNTSAQFNIGGGL